MNTERDGRQIDGEVASLLGEAAGQIMKHVEAAKTPFEVWKENPAALQRANTEITYYDRPLVKEPVWVWSVPAYMYAGGAAGAALALGAAAQLSGDSETLVHRCRWIGMSGVMLGSALLVYDLGRPGRFMNMLRVFRPTSPMNIGSWLLAATGSLAGLAVLSGNKTRRASDAAAIGAGIVGIPLSGYTGVLLANTAIPIWREARRSLPVLFIASGMASAAALLHLMQFSSRDESVVRRFGIAGQAAELISMAALQREVSRVEEVAKLLKQGFSGFLWKAAGLLGAASLVLGLIPTKSRRIKTMSGVCGTAAALSLRFSLLQAGRNSARDPRASFQQQRSLKPGEETRLQTVA